MPKWCFCFYQIYDAGNSNNVIFKFVVSDFDKGQETQTFEAINTNCGEPAIILVDAATRKPIQVHRLSSKNNANVESLPYTMKDVKDDFIKSESGMVISP